MIADNYNKKVKGVVFLSLIFFLALVSMVSAKDFVIRNESDVTQNYFVVNGTTGNIDVTGTGFFGWLGSSSDKISKLWVDEIAVTTNISTPKLCLGGNCQTSWGDVVSGVGGWNDTGSAVELLYNTRNVSAGTFFVDNTNERVGIGTTSPSSKLHLYDGDSTATPYVNSNLIIENSAGSFINLLSGPNQVQGIMFGDPENALSGYVRYSHTDDSMKLYTNGTAKVSILNDGSLGIGTEVPKNKLDVEGGAVIGATYSGTNTAPINGLLVEGNVGIGTATPGGKLDITSTSGDQLRIKYNDAYYWTLERTAGGDFSLLNTHNSVAQDPAFFIESENGNVGINETVPEAALHITTADDTTALILQGSTSNGGAALEFAYGGNNAANRRIGRIFGNEAGSGVLDFQMAADYNDPYSTKMTLERNGYFGIGDTDPDFMLEVVGNFSVSSSKDADGDVFFVNGSSGNVGIGTTSPGYSLDVDGDINVQTGHKFLLEGNEIAIPSDKNLVGYWAFDDVSGTLAVDGSGNGNDGTLVNSPAWVDGVVGTGLNFNATAERFTLDIPIGTAATYTVSLWYKRTPRTTSYNSLVCDKTTNKYHLLTNSAWSLEIYDGSHHYFGYTIPDDGLFHHYAVIYVSNSTADLYVDGAWQSQIAHSMDLSVNQFSAIGNGGGSELDYQAGPIDEVRIYDTALTEAEIKALYLSPAGSKGLKINARQLAGDLIVDSDGEVGIGTSSPEQKLDVNGTIKTNDILLIQKDASDTIQQGPSVYLDGGSGSSYTQLQQGIGKFVIWGFNGGWSEKMVINHSSGSIGIGETNPDVPLAFPDGIGSKIQLNGDNTNGYKIDIAANVDGGDAMMKFTAGETSAGEIGFYTTTQARMLINEDGNVGIGTTVPYDKLTTKDSTAGINDVLGLEYGGSVGDGANLNWRIGATEVGQIQQTMTGSGQYKMSFNNWDGSSLANQITINPYLGTKVGIGETNPADTLHLKSATHATLNIEGSASGNYAAGIHFNPESYTDGHAVIEAYDDSYTSVTEYTDKLVTQTYGHDIALAAYGANDEIQFYTGGRAAANRRMTINSSGSIGIGTTNPTLNAVTTPKLVVSDGTDKIGFGFEAGTPRLVFDDTATSVRHYIDNNNGVLRFYNHDGSSYSSPRLTINGTSGNIGIGATPTNSKVKIVDTDQTDKSHGLEIFENQEAGYSGLFLDTGHYSNDGRYHILANTSSASGDVTVFSVAHSGNAYFAGDVGIGATSPNYPLHVNGTLMVNVGGTNGGYYGTWIDGGDGNDPKVNIGDWYNSKVELRWDSSADDFIINTSATGDIILQPGGNVGIGTSSPAGKLTIQQGLGFAILAGADVNAATLTDVTRKFVRIGMPHYTNAEEPTSLIVGDSQETLSYVSIGGGANEMNAVTYLKFMTAENTTTLTGTERMRIDSSGNVGIGTSSPDTMLHILYPSYIDKDTKQGVLRLTGQSNAENSGDIPSAGTAIEFYNKWAGGAEFSVGRISGRASQTYDGGLQFDVAQNTGAGQDNFATAMTILDTGNVGINTTSPQNTLNVVGDLNVTSGGSTMVVDSDGDVRIGI